MIMISLPRRSLTFAAFLALPALASADVIVVAAGGGGQFTSLQPAVNAAAEGDTLLVKAGTYAGFTVDAKSLSITADTAAVVNVTSSVVVQNLSAAQTVVLGGLKVKGSTTTAMTDTPGVALLATSNAGAVRADGCEFTGAKGYGDGVFNGSGECVLPNHFWGWHAAKLDQNPGGVAFVGCFATGGRGANASESCYDGFGGPGGDGIVSNDTRVALYDCMLTGGEGGDNGSQGGVGGAGCRMRTSTQASAVSASGTTFQGGHGGDGYDYIYSHGGNGGDGLVMEDSTLGWRLDDAFAGGTGGLACFGAFPEFTGDPGVGVSGPGGLFDFPGGRLKLLAPNVVRENTVMPLTLVGTPGEHVFLRVTSTTDFRPLASWYGVILAGHAPHQAQFVMDLGTIPGSGTLSTALNFSDVSSARLQFLQPYSIDAGGHKKLGSLRSVVEVDASY
jgi:hypothetical protein